MRTGGYVTAGLTLYGDAENHWRLALVAGPQDQRYFELIERHQGVHQAQLAPPPAKTRLAGKHEGNLAGWEYGRYVSPRAHGDAAIDHRRDPARR